MKSKGQKNALDDLMIINELYLFDIMSIKISRLRDNRGARMLHTGPFLDRPSAMVNLGSVRR